MEEKIKDVIELIRPSLINDGGDVEFVALEDNKVKVRLKGHCVGCEFSQMTIKNGIEKFLRDEVDAGLIVESVE